MTFIPIDIQTVTGSQRVEAIPHGQVAVHASLNADGDYDDDVWIVTHIKTGFMVLATESMVKATQAAIALREIDLDDAVALYRRTGRYPRRAVRMIDRLKKKYGSHLAVTPDGQVVRADVKRVVLCPDCKVPMDAMMESVNVKTGVPLGELLLCERCGAIVGTERLSHIRAPGTDNMVTAQYQTERAVWMLMEVATGKSVDKTGLHELIDRQAENFVNIAEMAIRDGGDRLLDVEASEMRDVIWRSTVDKTVANDGSLTVFWADDGPMAVAFERIFKERQQAESEG